VFVLFVTPHLFDLFVGLLKRLVFIIFALAFALALGLGLGLALAFAFALAWAFISYSAFARCYGFIRRLNKANIHAFTL
jgi:predicted Co/Zn/Cd cation transporter (cation efflux family)